MNASAPLPPAGSAINDPAPDGPATDGSPPSRKPAAPNKRRIPPAPSAGKLLLALLFGACLACLGAWAAEPIRRGLTLGLDFGRGLGATWLSAQALSPQEGAGRYYTCGMHPWVIVPQTGDCPICHMALVPLDPRMLTGDVVIDPLITQRIAVRSEPVVWSEEAQPLRGVGRVAYDESRQHVMALKFGGWVERLGVTRTGQAVQAGQMLLEIYAPDLLIAQQAYRDAWRRVQPRSDGVTAANSGLAAAVLAGESGRLAALDQRPDDLRLLETDGPLSRTATIRSPISGVVIEKNLVAGQFVAEGETLLRINDLSQVWVLARFQQRQGPLLKVGQKAEIRLPNLPEKRLEGQVVAIDPYLDPQSRQITVRLELPNPRGELKPGMLTSVLIQTTFKEPVLVIPRSAVLDTGVRQVVFLDRGQGKFEPREVQLGLPASGSRVQVLEGLEEDDRIVTSGQFLLDSEARTRQALVRMLAVPEPERADGHAPGLRVLEELTPAQAEALAAVIRTYRALADQLASDRSEMEAERSALQQAINTLRGAAFADPPDFWLERSELERIETALADLEAASDLAAARAAFLPLSLALVDLLSATGVPETLTEPVELLECSMYESAGQWGLWLSGTGAIRNPYFGAMMLRCITGRSALPVSPVREKANAPVSAPHKGSGRSSRTESGHGLHERTAHHSPDQSMPLSGQVPAKSAESARSLKFVTPAESFAPASPHAEHPQNTLPAEPGGAR